MNILIVGATSGIGRELCWKYAEEGNRVFATGRRRALLEELSKRYSCIKEWQMDIAHLSDTCEALQRIWDEAEHVDIAIVCAGIGDLNPILSPSVNQETIRTNVMGWTNLVDNLFNRFCQQQSGHLVVLSSLNALRGEPIAPAYSASKAFQRNYAEALCKKAFQSGSDIHVTEIRPGLVDTAMAKGEGLFWVMPADKVACQIISAIHARVRVCVVTRRWRIVAFIMAHLPWFLYKRI